MSELLLPVAQFMPAVDPIGSMLGCWIFVFLLVVYVFGFIATGAGIRSILRNHLQSAQFARAAGALVFGSALLLFLFFSRAMIRSHRDLLPSLLIAAAAPAILGLVAWILGARTASRPEIWIAPFVVIASAGIAVVMMRSDLDFRGRRDALLAAAKSGDALAVRKLLATGFSADLRDHNHNTLLMLAPDAATTEALLAGGARVDADPRTLAFAAEKGNVSKMTVLLAHGADPNGLMGGRSPALLAWWSKQDAAVELLRQAGSRDAATLQQTTGALARAIEKSDADEVERLLAAEYVREERTEGLKVAARRNDAAILSLLMASTMAHSEIASAVLVAAEHDRVAAYVQMMDELDRREAGFIRIETTDAALAIAAKRHNLEIARDAIARTEPGAPTPLDRARERGDAAVVALLLAAGAKDG